MTCVATQDETIALVFERLATLQDIQDKGVKDLRDIQHIFSKAAKEIESTGLTPETCREMARIINPAEGEAQGYKDGLKSVHQSMALLIPADANEGGKEWP